MKIYFKSLTIPKKAAKRVQNYFTNPDLPFDPMKLSRAQEITASMLGYNDWHELVSTTKNDNHTPSLLDEECDVGTQLKRIKFQNDRFSAYSPLIENVRREITIKLRVSAKNPKSAALSEQNFNLNKIQFWTDPFDKRSEWRFFPSQRSEDRHKEVWDFHNKATNEEYSFGDYFEGLEKMLSERPEDMYVIEEMLRVSQEFEFYDLVEPYIDTISEEINKCFPSNFPSGGFYNFCWGTIENRSLLRSTFWLALNYYRLGKWSIAYR